MKEKMPEEKNIEPCELKNLVYEIADLNESAIVVLEKENVTELNKVITVLKCQEDKINLLLSAFKEKTNENLYCRKNQRTQPR